MGELNVSKRGLIRAIWGATTVGVGGAAALTLGTDPAAAVQGDGLTAEDLTVESNDGELSTLAIAPDVTVSWQGQESQVADVKMTWTASVPDSGSSGSIGSETAEVSSPTKQGEVSHTFGDLSVLQVASASTFGSSADGESVNTDVEIAMDVKLIDDSGNNFTTKQELLSGTYTVTVTNEESSVSASGTANTSGS